MRRKHRAEADGPPQPLIFHINPISVRIPQAVAMTGLSRTRIYQLIGSGELQIAKDGNCTLILVESLRGFIAKLTTRAKTTSIDPENAAV